MSNTIRSGLRQSRLLLIPLLGLVLTVCTRADDQRAMDTAADTAGAVPPATETTPGTTVPPGGVTTVLTTPEVVEVLSASDSAEIRPSELALQKSQNSMVKAFAERMITDHGMLEDSLHAMARRQNIESRPSTLSNQLDSQTESAMQRLQGLSGAEFDQAYMQFMVQSHEEALSMIDNQLLPSMQDQQLRMAITEKVRPIVIGHLEEARQIQQAIASGVGTQAGSN